MTEAASLDASGPRKLGAAVRGYFTDLAVELRSSVVRHRWLLGLILAYWLAGMVVADYANLPAGATIETYLPVYMKMMPGMLVTLVIGRCLVIMLIERPARPLTQIIRELRGSMFIPRRLANALPMLLAMLVFGGTFTVIKSSIPSFNPYSWDVTFEAWDRWLHGGIAPWMLLHPLLGRPSVTHYVNIAYAVWFIVLCFTWVWQVFSLRDERLRRQFLWTLLIVWIVLGSIAAMYLSSAGPCYFGRITGLPNPFEPLMTYLQQASANSPIWALTAQDMLWQNYLERDVQLATGISAMPSLHVALTTLFSLVCWRTNRWLGALMTVYAMAIMIGSVHLGWHYAVDGYVGALGSCLIWWIVGRCLPRQGAGRDPTMAEHQSHRT
jgi:hypothetical protein